MICPSSFYILCALFLLPHVYRRHVLTLYTMLPPVLSYCTYSRPTRMLSTLFSPHFFQSVRFSAPRRLCSPPTPSPGIPYQIFDPLPLSSLLHLTLVSSPLRRFLLSAACESMWKAAMARKVLPFEEMEEKMKPVELAWLVGGKWCRVSRRRLAFFLAATRRTDSGRFMQSCGKNTARRVDYSLRVRLCSKCWDNECVSLSLHSSRSSHSYCDTLSPGRMSSIYAQHRAKLKEVGHAFASAHTDESNALLAVLFLCRIVYEGPDEPDPAFEGYTPGVKRYSPRSRTGKGWKKHRGLSSFCHSLRTR